MTAPFDLDKFKSKPAGYVIRDGKRIAVDELESKTPARKKRAPFKARFTQLPEFWGAELEKLKSATTWQLARRTLREVHRRQHVGGSVVLSTAVTGLAPTSRQRATKNMLRLKLFSIEQIGRQAAVVTKLFLGDGEVFDLKQHEGR